MARWPARWPDGGASSSASPTVALRVAARIMAAVCSSRRRLQFAARRAPGGSWRASRRRARLEDAPDGGELATVERLAVTRRCAGASGGYVNARFCVAICVAICVANASPEYKRPYAAWLRWLRWLRKIRGISHFSLSHFSLFPPFSSLFLTVARRKIKE